ncbi:VOC family protein [Streptomyces boncukensis]|uniref:VOC family protein n=1 Tax=Streptomyces boncukensis TaxID=2711219 RepID=A0A6G4X4F7_9ACTN|nr:VOC family protein [Streptomyces boncukensis]NGO71737.1 VOC family protein [Streptomyces boncukensis]
MTTRLGSLDEFCWMDVKTADIPGTTAFFEAVLGWRSAVDESDWRRAVKLSLDGRPVGGVSDLASPVYPPGTPPHIAFYLAVDDVDARAEVATANGAHLVVPPFTAGDQGRIATLIDPVGAAFSLWQADASTGWEFPAGLTGVPHRVVLPSEQPDKARHFYRDTLGVTLECAEFAAAYGRVPQWELAVLAGDPDDLASRVRAHGAGQAVWSTGDTGEAYLRVGTEEGLTVRCVPADRAG